MGKTIQKRKVYLDILRIMAIYMVFFNHTGTNGFTLFTVKKMSLFCNFYLYCGILIKMAVPIFFMVSGAVLLGKNEAIQTILQKRVIRFIAIIIVASFIMYLYSLNGNMHEFSIKYFIKELYSEGVIIPYWYLYSYLAYLLSLPFLRKIAQGLNNKEYIYMIAIYFGIQCLNVLQFFNGNGNVVRNHYFVFFFMENNIFFPLLGYFLENRLPERYLNKKNVIFLILTSLFFIVLTGKITLYRCNHDE